jgi:hypothetical protein
LGLRILHINFYFCVILYLINFELRYVKFDTFTPAVERGLPVTRVISRMTLQQILANSLGDEIVLNDSNVVDFVDDGNKVD